MAGEALTGATEQVTQPRARTALPSRCRHGNPAQTQAEEELAFPAFTFLVASCTLQVQEEH